MNERTMKRALLGAVLACVMLGAALAYLLLQGRDRRAVTVPVEGGDPVVARGPAQASAPASANEGKAAAGEPALGRIELSPAQLQQISVTTALVERKEVNDGVDVPGSVAVDEQRISYVQTRFAGWIRDVQANALYQYVRKGQKLFTIYSPDLVSTEQEYLLAKQNQTGASMHMHGTAAEEGNWLLQAAEERLRRYDIANAEIANLERTGTVQHEIAVTSPASGYILERNALPNAYVQPETKLYTIADLSTVWVYANVSQSDVGRLKPGNRAEVMVDAYPGRTFAGRVDQILPDVDAATRTVKVRLVLQNAGLALKPGMYVRVKIAAPLGMQLVIPEGGVLRAGSRQVAYVDRGDGVLEGREIETGTHVGDGVVVVKGLQAGERIVSSANFLVDSEAQLQATRGVPVEAAPHAATGAEGETGIEFSTRPDPPHRGANTLRVQLHGADGKPVAGAQVTVSFFMAAMPAMGMAALHETAQLADRGAGVYEGSMEVGSGGTWEVTVSASRGGKVLARKRLSASVAGGMA